MTKCIALLALLLFVGPFGCASEPSGIHRESFSYGDETRRYAVYTPAGYDSSKRYPTILFLHGLFESGNDAKDCTKVGIGLALRKHPERYNCVVVFAQTSGSWHDDDQLPLAMATLDDACRRYGVDPARVVLTGLSTGGGAVWKLGAQYPNRFAALAPMCAYGDADDASRLTGYNIWAFHNRFDPFVGVWNTSSMCEQINADGGHAKKTVYGALGHNCWDEAYGDPDVAAWLTSQVIGGTAKFTSRTP